MTDLVERVRRRMASTDRPDLTGAVRAESLEIVDDVVLASLSRDVAAELTGAGPLEPLLALPDVTDVLVNGPDAVWLDRGRGLERAPARFVDDDAVRRLAQRLAATAGRRLDDALPFVDGALPDGTRLHAVLPPLCPHPTISLRTLTRRRYDLGALVAQGGLPGPVATLLASLVAARLAFVVTGGTGSGKTTLLGALLGCVPAHERVVTIEDVAELVIEHPHVVRLLARAANVEGAGGVGLRELVRQALRMRPDRLVVGELRGAEMAELLVALNTGHEGGAATLHANSAADVPARLAALGALAGWDGSAVAALAGSALEVVVHLRRLRDGARVVAEVGRLTRSGPELAVTSVWSMRSGLGAGAPAVAAAIADRGVAVPELLR